MFKRISYLATAIVLANVLLGSASYGMLEEGDQRGLSIKQPFKPASTEDYILKCLHNAGYKTDGYTSIQPMRGVGSNTEKIYLIQLGQEGGKETQLICKELKGKKKEIENLEALRPFADEYEKFTESQPYALPQQHPILATYRGALKQNDREFALFKLASGESVFDLMIEWTQKGYGYYSCMRPAAAKNKMSYHFENVGRATANFYLKHGKFDEEENIFRTMRHGDLHISNIFYNIYTNGTTFIDYETMKTDEVINYDAYRLFSFSKDEIFPLVKERAGIEFCRSRDVILLNKQAERERDAYIMERLTILDDFFYALEKGFTQGFERAGYICDTSTWQVKRRGH
ncbi:MAG: hypothetical protein H0X26_00820 [Alphaproteobacteria bacterium]|nr:hypothetical protein [Alphaproteobacteria bacterium]